MCLCVSERERERNSEPRIVRGFGCKPSSSFLIPILPSVFLSCNVWAGQVWKELWKAEADVDAWTQEDKEGPPSRWPHFLLSPQRSHETTLPEGRGPATPGWLQWRMPGCPGRGEPLRLSPQFADREWGPVRVPLESKCSPSNVSLGKSSFKWHCRNRLLEGPTSNPSTDPAPSSP